jgi:hypothetical protein
MQAGGQIIRAERRFYYQLLLVQKFDVIKPSRLVNQVATGSAPSRREGQFLSQPRTRQSSAFVRQPKSGGNITPTILPNSCCWLCKRPAISATHSPDKPRSWKACSRAWAACCVWQRSRSRRSCAFRRRRCLALACFVVSRVLGTMGRSFTPLGSVAVAVCTRAHDTGLPPRLKEQVSSAPCACHTSCFPLL